MVLIVEYSIGEDYVFTATSAVPVEARSKDEFFTQFDLAMAAFEPGKGMEWFVCCGQAFEYRHFIEWREKQVSKRRVEHTYDSVRPDLYTVDEWLNVHREKSKSIIGAPGVVDASSLLLSQG